MPEFNRNFAQGKMNKDLDERLVPAGQYRDALNVELSTSEGSNVGALQTVHGNTELTPAVMPPGSYCVGSIVNNEENCIYYLVAGAEELVTQGHRIQKDAIIKYNLDTNTSTYVFVDIYSVKTVIETITSFGHGAANIQGGGFITVSSPIGLRTGMTAQGVGDVEGTYKPGPLAEFDPQSLLIAQGNAITANVGDVVRFYPKQGRILNFDGDRDITGINIVDDFLMFTDGVSEPKMINIKRSILGTGVVEDGSLERYLALNTLNNNSGMYHTRLVTRRADGEFLNDGLEVAKQTFHPYHPVWAEVENCTTIKKGPLAPPTLRMSSTTQERDGRVDATVTTTDFIIQPPSNNAGDPVPTGTTITLVLDNETSFVIGDFLTLTNDLDQPALSFTKEDVRVQVVEPINGGTYPAVGNEYQVMVTSINPELDTFATFYVLLEQKTPLFEFKFPRFGYRYKYVDGQYSAFSPFSEVAFLPGPYTYYPKEGYNLAMTNRVRSLKVENYAPHPSHRAADIVEIDILYKEERSPTIYTVKTIKPSDGGVLWPKIESPYFGLPANEANFESVGNFDASNPVNYTNIYRGSINIESELIHAVVPENQLLRPWDNVPRTAKAQEVSGNRLIYANYLQNYDLKDTFEKLVTPEIILSAESEEFPETLVGTARKHVKSMRTYQLGVVYKDKYGRETPVLADKDKGSFTTSKELCASSTALVADIVNAAPEWAESFKFFIKETADEYYNLAMDRWYNAEDGNLWLSFNSSDRNKVDIETFLELKKSHDNDGAVTVPARYKILAIENEAPQDIKRKRASQGMVINGTHDGVANNLIGDSVQGFPTEGQNFVIVEAAAMEEAFGEAGANNDSGIAKLRSRASECSLKLRRATGAKSEYYEITRIDFGQFFNNNTEDGYKIVLADVMGPDVVDPCGATYATRNSLIQLEITHDTFEDKPEFDGKFFVKLFKDRILEDNIMILNDDNLVVIRAFGAKYIHTYRDNFDPHVQNTNDQPTGLMWNVFDPYWATLADDDHNNPYNPTYTWDDDASGPGTVGVTEVSSPGSLIPAEKRGIGKYDNGSDFWGYIAPTNSSGNQTPVLFIDDAWALSWRHTPHTIHDSLGNWDDVDGIIHNAPSYNASMNDGLETAYWDGQSGGYFNGSHGIHGNQIDLSVTGFRPAQDTDSISDQTPAWLNFLSGTCQNVAENQPLGEFIQTIREPGVRWRFQDDPDKTVYRTTGSNHHFGIINHQVPDGDILLNYTPPSIIAHTAAEVGNFNFAFAPTGKYYRATNKRNKFTIRVDKNFGDYYDPRSAANHDGSSLHAIEILGPFSSEDAGFSSDNPAVFETYPKENVELDIYYEISRAYPIKLNPNQNQGPSNDETFALKGSRIVAINGEPFVNGFTNGAFTYNNEPEDLVILDIQPMFGVIGTSVIQLVGNSGANIRLEVGDRVTLEDGYGGDITVFVAYATHSNILNAAAVAANEGGLSFGVSNEIHGRRIKLPWFNCYSFGNGVESNRIRDDFNQPFITNGVKASTTIAEQYKEEQRKEGLIFSGIYNSKSGVNRLNQFIQAEPITKDLNPDNGSIQKLFTRDTDIVTFCEDKVLKILSQKDALFNADGNTNVTATSKVLGAAIPFQGDYGISKNPESFASDEYRCYFADTQRGSVLRLSKDGITNISEYGMKDWFTDKFYALNNPRVLGGFDARKNNYNITISERN